MDKDELKSKALTVDESSEKIQFDDCNVKENKNSDKKFKKFHKSNKVKDLPLIDLVEFAFIKNDPINRSDLEKKRDCLLARQVQNWTEVHKSRRNEKI